MNIYYVARDEDGDLKLFNEPPERRDYDNGNSIWVGWNIRLKDNEMFKELDWCNNPIEVTLNIQKYEQDIKQIEDDIHEGHENQIEPEQNGTDKEQG